MPIYEYQCPQCQNIFEEWLGINEINNKIFCPECNTEASRLISHTAFVLKGGGWYVTEYGNRKNSNTNHTQSPKSASAGQGATEKGYTKEATAKNNPTTSSASVADDNKTKAKVASA